jgi:hypothetical protein
MMTTRVMRGRVVMANGVLEHGAAMRHDAW